MTSIIKTISTAAALDDVWDAIRDVGALHTRLVPGFVVGTELADGERYVRFADGKVVIEPIVSIDDQHHRLVWTVRGGGLQHYNGALRASASEAGGTDLTWTVDMLPDEFAEMVATSMTAGIDAMQRALDQLAE